MCIEQFSNVVFDEVNVIKDIFIDYDVEKEEVVVQAPTPPRSKKELEFFNAHTKEMIIESPLQGLQNNV